MCEQCSTHDTLKAFCKSCDEFVMQTPRVNGADCSKCGHKITENNAPWTPDNTFAHQEAPGLNPDQAVEDTDTNDPRNK